VSVSIARDVLSGDGLDPVMGHAKFGLNQHPDVPSASRRFSSLPPPPTPAAPTPVVSRTAPTAMAPLDRGDVISRKIVDHSAVA